MADLNAIANGTVEDARGKLSDLSAAELKELRQIEEKGKNRSTLLDAIDEASEDAGETGEGEEEKDQDQKDLEARDRTMDPRVRDEED